MGAGGVVKSLKVQKVWVSIGAASEVYLRIAGAFAIALFAAGCKWSSADALLTSGVIDNSPIKPGTYVHGDATYKVEGKHKGPILVTAHSGSSDTTYSIAFDKISGKFFLVQALSGSDIAYEIIETKKDGFVEYRMDCSEEDKTLATSSGATIRTEDSACVFPSYESLKNTARQAVDAIKSGAVGYPGDSYIRQK